MWSHPAAPLGERESESRLRGDEGPIRQLAESGET